jgi:uncharacterized membrane protein HdeD (DUF308 family)
MTNAAVGLSPINSGSSLANVNWKWIVALGVVYVIAGLVALGSVAMATFTTVFLVGIMMVIAGIAEVIGAFQVKKWTWLVLSLLLGALYIAAGAATFENPLLAAIVLTLVLGISLTVSGITRIILGIAMRQSAPWFGVVLSGCLTFLLGVVVLVHWPVSSVYVLGLFLGIDLVMAGAARIAIGFGLKKTV